MKLSGFMFPQKSERWSWAALAGVVAAALVLLSVPAVARGPVKATGSVLGEGDAKITMKIQRNGGQPSAVPLLKVKNLNFSCFDSGESGEFRIRVENFFDVQRTFDESGKRVWNLLSKRRNVKTDEFGRVALSVFGTTDRKASRVAGTIGVSFGAGCINDQVDGFDTYALSARD